MPHLGIALITGATFGAISGAIAGCELSGVIAEFGGRCAPGGALTGGMLGTLIAVGALRTATGPSTVQPGRARAAAGLLAAWGLCGLALWIDAWRTTPIGLDQLGPFIVGLGMLPALAWLVVLGRGLLRRRSWARWAGLVTFAAVIPGAVGALVNVAAGLQAASRPYASPPGSIVPPAIFTAIGVGGVLALGPPLSRRAGRRARQRHPTQGIGSPEAGA